MSAAKEEFYEKYAQAAIEQQIKYGIPASLTLAQMAVESGVGTNTLSTQYNNFFSVKKGSSWDGPVTYHLDDHSYKEAFRVYGSVEECMEDHSKVLMKPVYQKNVRNLSSTDGIGWANGIGRVYATSGSYTNMLIKEMRDYGLAKYDQMAVQQASRQGVQIGYMQGNPSKPTTPSTSQKVQLVPLQGNWALPIDFSKVEVSSEYGMRKHPISGQMKNHNGLDLSSHGQRLPVFATEDAGKVVKVGNQKEGAGNYVTIEYDRADGTKIQATYMHLSEVGVKENDIVKAGQTIGVSGNTGGSTGVHLHFETKYMNENGEWQRFDSAQYLAEMEVRGNMPLALNKNGKDYLAEARSNMVVGDSQNGTQLQQDPNMALLANITNSNDPTKWLAYLMEQNGESTDGQDIISSLISRMFKAAISMAAVIKADELADETRQTESQGQCSAQSQEANTVVKRERETIDVKALQMQVSANYEAECPEQQQSNGQRLA